MYLSVEARLKRGRGDSIEARKLRSRAVTYVFTYTCRTCVDWRIDRRRYTATYVRRNPDCTLRKVGPLGNRRRIRRWMVFVEQEAERLLKLSRTRYFLFIKHFHEITFTVAYNFFFFDLVSVSTLIKRLYANSLASSEGV